VISDQRQAVYRRQTGRPTLTPRQRRRDLHKTNRALGWDATNGPGCPPPPPPPPPPPDPPKR
jgi:hypothetical protein